MSHALSGVKRQPDAAGENVAVYRFVVGSTTYVVQSVALADDSGAQIGIPGNPFIVTIDPSSPPAVGVSTEAKQDDGLVQLAAMLVELQSILGELQTQNSLVPVAFEAIDLTYTGTKISNIAYKDGGGGTVSQLALTYGGPGGRISRIERI